MIKFDGMVRVSISNRAHFLSRKSSNRNLHRMKLPNEHMLKTRWKLIVTRLSGSRWWSWRTWLALDYFQRKSAMVCRELVCLFINNLRIFSIYWVDSIGHYYVGSRHSSYIDRCVDRVLVLTDQSRLSKQISSGTSDRRLLEYGTLHFFKQLPLQYTLCWWEQDSENSFWFGWLSAKTGQWVRHSLVLVQRIEYDAFRYRHDSSIRSTMFLLSLESITRSFRMFSRLCHPCAAATEKSSKPQTALKRIQH